MDTNSIIQIIGFAVMILSFYFTSVDRRKKASKEIKTETKETVQNETAQTFQLQSLKETQNDHEIRLRNAECKITEHNIKFEGVKESLDRIEELQNIILSRLPESGKKASSY